MEKERKDEGNEERKKRGRQERKEVKEEGM